MTQSQHSAEPACLECDEVESRFIAEAISRVRSPWLRYCLSLHVEILADQYVALENVRVKTSDQEGSDHERATR